MADSKKDILMIVHTMGNLLPTDNDRFTYLANILYKKGYSVEIVTSDFDHHKKCYRDKNIVETYPFKITFLHENRYVKNVSLQRIISHHSFASRLRRYLKCRNIPDVIYCAVPPLSSALATAKFSNKHKIKFVVDIQDLWPETFAVILGHGPLFRILTRPIAHQANGIYRRADEIVGVSQTYVDRAAKVNKIAKNKTVVFLGTDGQVVADSISGVSSPLGAENSFKLAYVGNLGFSYDFENVFKALALLKKQGINNIQFFIFGDGNERHKVEALSAHFFPETKIFGYLPYKQMLQLLAQCDLALNPIAPGGANSVVNKVGDYAAAGIAVVNSQENAEYRELLEKYNAGLNAVCGNFHDMAEKIEFLYKNEKIRKEMGKNNRLLFEEKFDRRLTYSKIIDCICGIPQ